MNIEINKNFNYKKRFILIGIFGLSSLLLLIMSNFIGSFADWYNKYIYEILVNSVSRVLSMFPFSVYEVILYSFILFIVSRAVWYIILLIKKKIKFKQVIIRSVTNILLYVSIFAFLNMVTQGVNCFKSSFAALTNLEEKKPTEENLIKLCTYLKDNLNELDSKIQKDKNGMFIVTKDVKRIGIDNMKRLAGTYDCLKGFYPNAKGYVFSKLMSYQLLQGESTFTIEANYNNDMNAQNIPSTICHELSHIRGFNNEDEANYISFLACINSNDYNFQYSGYLMAYIYCMNDLYYFNKDAYNEINSSLSENVAKEIKEDVLYWRPYRGIVSNIYNFIYDKLLKMVGQGSGIKSYNNVVKLLISGQGVQFDID